MGLIATLQTKLADKLMEFALKKSSGTWGKLWEIAQEWKMFGNIVTKPYEQISSVYKSIKAIADNVPQAKLKFYAKDNPDKEVKPADIVALFENPNPLMSINELLEAIVIFHGLYGECFLVLTQSLGQLTGARRLPAEIWTFNPTYFQQIIDNGRLIGWRYKYQQLKVEEVIHIRDFHPYNEFRGLSPLKPIQKTIDIDWLSLIYNKSFFENDASPGFMLGTDKALTAEQRTRITEWWNKEYKGASKAFKVAVLEAGLKPLTIGINQKEMQFIEQKRFMREEIIGIWRVPKAMFSITDDLNYATFIGQKKVFWTDTLMPILRKIEDEFNSQFFTRYAPDVRCRFDYSNVIALQEDFKDKVQTAKELFNMGFTANEVNDRLQLGFEKKPWRDYWWVPFSLLPAGSSAPAAAEGNNGKQIKTNIDDVMLWKVFLNKHTLLESKFANAVKRFFYEQRKRALGSLGSKSISKVQIGLNWDFENKELIEKSLPYVLGGIKEGADLAKEIIGGQINEDVLNGKIKSYLAVRLQKLKGVNETIKNQLRRELEEAITAGETINQISDRIRNVYNMASVRAKLIARTETTGAVNGGSELYYKESNVEKKKWVTAGDEAVRATHAAINGEIVRINERFSNGLDFPGGDGSAGEVVNCRCTISPVIEE